MVTIRLKVSPEVFLCAWKSLSSKNALIVVRIVSLSAGAWITAPSVRSESHFCELKRRWLISDWKSARSVHKPNPFPPHSPSLFFVSSCFVEQLEIMYDGLQLTQFGGYPHWPNLLAYWCLPSSPLCSNTLHCCCLQRILLFCVIGCWAMEAQSASLWFLCVYIKSLERRAGDAFCC